MRRRRTRVALPVVLTALLWPSAVPAPAGAQAPTTSDPGRSRQWALDLIGTSAAWTVATGEGVTIAIVDSGIDTGHPDLRDKVDATTDCVGNDDAPGGCLDGGGGDDAGHGTHVAGIAAASSDNAQGIAGVAPMARLLGVRVLANSCAAGTDPAGPECEAEGTESDVAEGIRWAADHGADVINLSLGSVTQAVVGPGRSFADALDHAWAQGAIPVLVAGNDLLLPGSVVDVPAVIVSATNRADQKASYSNGVGNVRWGVSAPGGESDSADSCDAAQPNGILSTFFVPAAGGGGSSSYACVAGTSMAAPHVAGALALLRSAGLAPEDAVERLLTTADDLGPAGPDSTFGAGRINVARALAGSTPTGQPVSADGAGAATGTEVVPTTAPADPAVPPDTTPPVTVAPGQPAVSTATTGVGGITPPVATDAEPALDAGAEDDDVGGEVAVSERVPGVPEDVPLPAGPLTAAVLAVAAVATGHAWRYLASTNLGRRTPREF